jgi:hypothetical protein
MQETGRKKLENDKNLPDSLRLKQDDKGRTLPA